MTGLTRTVVSSLRYTPYGLPRGETGRLPTPYRYTGQRETGVGFYDYQARLYDPAVGRFAQADTLVPEPGRPQSLNRYMYTLGNPLKYVDPTGYFIQCTPQGTCYDDGYSVDNPAFVSLDEKERRTNLRDYNDSLFTWARKGWITDLDALAQLADFAASMIPPDIKGDRSQIFVDDMASVLTELMGEEGFWGEAKSLGQTGFDIVFQDPSTGGKQPHHFWAYVTYVFHTNSRLIATIGNLGHETLIGQPPPWKDLRMFGRSYQDFALGQEGVNMGVALRNGTLDVNEVGAYIRQNFGPDGYSVSRWRGTPGATFNQYFYAFFLAIASKIRPIPAGEQGAP